MIKPETLDLPPLNCSLDRELGDYYQDLSAAIQLGEGGYHGSMDANGVPLVSYQSGSFHNPISIAQYALANMTAFRRGEASRERRARAQLDWLVSAQCRDGEWTGCWVMAHDDPKYPWLRTPWSSALTSGNAISALLRGWQLFDDNAYGEAGHLAYEGLHAARDQALYEEAGSELWYEEYPGVPPVHVLNGHVYALFGVADYARVTGDSTADARWRRAAATALSRLAEFDLGYWSAYDLRWREPVTLHYQKNIHIPQMRILAALTGEPEFGVVADRWERYWNSRLSRLRWYVGVRVHARRSKPPWRAGT
jgi:heparosan-N-sulfate-glucuronate 5-epimerase